MTKRESLSDTIPAAAETATDLPIPVTSVAEAEIVDDDSQRAALERVLETVPNLNEQYQEELDLVRQQRTKDGLPEVPITVLTPENYQQVHDATNTGLLPEHIDVSGEYISGHAIVVEKPEQVTLYGMDYVLGNAFHEAAHHDMHQPSRITQSQTKKTEITGPPIAAFVGRFFDEGYAELSRVRGLRDVGRSWRAEGARVGTVAPDGAIVAYYGQGESAPLINNDLQSISLPIEYVGGVTPNPEGEVPFHVAVSVGSIAAYGISLLDERAPGLFEDLKNSSQDPEIHYRFVDKIERIQPGLYRELTAICQGEDYTSREFVDGFKRIAEALGMENSTIKF